MLAALLLSMLVGQEPLAVPSEADRKQAEKLIRDLFKDEFAKNTPADRALLARKLLKQAPEARADAPSCYALLSLAEDCALQSGNLDLVWTIFEETGKTFAVDIAARKEAALQKIPVRSVEDARKFSGLWLSLASELLSSGAFDRAEKAASNAASQGKRAKELPSVTRAEALGKEIADLKGKYKGLVPARQKLQAQADDPESNSIVGRFDCFVKGDWATGLPRLAKGSDPSLKEAAEEELSAPSDPVRIAAIADKWSALAEKETGSSRTTVLRHAGVHYRSAVSALTGLSKVKVEKRLEEIARLAGSVDEVNLLGLIDPEQDNALGAWSKSGDTLVSTATDIVEILYHPPADYDLRMTVERKGGASNLILGILVEGRQVAVVLDDGDIAGLSRIDGLKPLENKTASRGILLPPNKERTLVVTVRKGGVALLVDGQKIFDWKGEASRLSRNPSNPLRRSDALYLISDKSQFVVKQYVLTPISVPGRKLR